MGYYIQSHLVQTDFILLFWSSLEFAYVLYGRKIMTERKINITYMVNIETIKQTNSNKIFTFSGNI